ncbi:MAG: hypothetical protein H6548_06380 [Chitinophagales bacterium]|nr:hypothetical protein [Chitinophagales bacterium]HAE14124.1 hypothetical protein [Bacteroidota bacterium]MCB9021726.1 hypothetical protein [Chitinophagales bacterium]MCB9031023.1 hypothetical protein [Chitinophagales bacterium]HAE34247.1 hypothetical protein [Bacteroidota bacterium]
MDIRTLKKRVFYVIAEAIDHVNLDPSEKDAESKTDSLLTLFEETVTRINAGKRAGTNARAHFRQVKNEFNSRIQEILG